MQPTEQRRIRRPARGAVGLTLLAIGSFLLAELYFFLNPMLRSQDGVQDFFSLYLFPLLLYLVSLAALILLSQQRSHSAGNCLRALLLLFLAVWICAHLAVFLSDGSLWYLYYPHSGALWVSVPLNISLLTTGLCVPVHRRRTRGLQPLPRRAVLLAAGICSLLFVISILLFMHFGFAKNAEQTASDYRDHQASFALVADTLLSTDPTAERLRLYRPQRFAAGYGAWVLPPSLSDERGDLRAALRTLHRLGYVEIVRQENMICFLQRDDLPERGVLFGRRQGIITSSSAPTQSLFDTLAVVELDRFTSLDDRFSYWHGYGIYSSP